MPNRCVIDRKLRFEFARDLEQTILHAFTLRHPNSERELNDEEFERTYEARRGALGCGESDSSSGREHARAQKLDVVGRWRTSNG